MKKLPVILLLFSCLVLKGQNKVGAFLTASLTSIHNAANRAGDPIYKHTLTPSSGGGAYYVHYLTAKKFNGRKFHGRSLSSFRNRWALKGGMLYDAHNQSFRSEYKLGFDSTNVWKGKKRLDYVKAFIWIQHSYPFFHSKKLSTFWYTGLQGAYLVKADGGIVTWKHLNESLDYFDLPPAERKYYKSFNFEYTAGVGFEYQVNDYWSITTHFHFDWTFTTIDRTDITFPTFDQYGIDYGSYDRGNSRENSRATTQAIFIGAEYEFHRPEHARAKF